MASKTDRSSPTAQKLRKEVGKYLKALRQQKDLTQVAVSQALDYKYFTFVAQIEQGKSRVPPEDWGRWARLYGVDPETFGRRLLKHYDPHVYEICFMTGKKDLKDERC